MSVRECVVPALVPPDPARRLTDAVLDNAVHRPDRVVLARPGADGWQDVTADQFRTEVMALARGLLAAGIGAGARIALMARTRYEWTLADYAIWWVGGVTVPIYETSSAEQVAWILSDSGAVACFVETTAHAATVAGVRDRLPALVDVWTFDTGAVAELGALGADQDESELEARRTAVAAASVATIIYTSGTTGRPKGCELTHANFTDLALNAAARLGEVVSAEDASTLLFLPLAHVFARFVQVLCISSGARMGHAPDVRNLLADLASYRPTFVLAVPRVFEKIYNSSEARAVAEGRGGIFTAAAETAIAYSRAQDGRGPGLALRARHAVLDRLVYRRLRAALGGRVAWAVSGGAPLGDRLGHFFRGIGVTVLEGWGLTETTAPATVNTPDGLRIGSVGRPLPGVGVAVAEDGELLVSGINVMAGYHDNPEATADAVRDGWFRTGDLGEIDADGFVTITGRKKEIIVTAGGKNVAPAVMEDRLRAHPLVSQCMVVGDGRPFVACLITLDQEMLPGWLANHGRPPLELPQAVADPQVHAELQRAVDRANEAVSKAESIRKFRVLTTDFTEASGHLTPKSSIRRQVVLKDFGAEIEELYA